MLRCYNFILFRFGVTCHFRGFNQEVSDFLLFLWVHIRHKYSSTNLWKLHLPTGTEKRDFVAFLIAERGSRLRFNIVLEQIF